MIRSVLWAVIIVVTLALVWLSIGRRLTFLLDRLLTARALSLPVSPLEYDGGGFLIGKQSMTFGLTNNLRSDLQLTFDSSNRVILCAGQGTFVLGPRTNPVDPSGRPEITFVAEPGDELSFVFSRSFLSWPTPFEFQILGVASPRWRRNAYYRLVWRKPSGARLEMLWRYEQQYYSAGGWTAPMMMWNSRTGLLTVDIHPESKGPEGAVVQYMVRTKSWNPSEYRIERRGLSHDGQTEVFAVIHLSDEGVPAPGAGKSVELYVDRVKHQVTQELGGQ